MHTGSIYNSASALGNKKVVHPKYKGKGKALNAYNDEDTATNPAELPVHCCRQKKNKTSFKYFQNTYSLKLTLTNSQTSQDF